VNSFDLYQANAFAGCAPIHDRLFLMPSNAGALQIKVGATQVITGHFCGMTGNLIEPAATLRVSAAGKLLMEVRLIGLQRSSHPNLPF
jgi:hypothetical protein